MNKDDALAMYLQKTIPELVEGDVTSASGVIVSIPQESPDGAYLRENSSALALFERSLKYNRSWVKPGYRSGANGHNVSVTISVKEEEWDDLGEKLWKHRNEYNGISLLPYDGGSYRQAPFETISKEDYDKMTTIVKEVELKNVMEKDDNTERMESIACAGGVCELT